jgi:asparagine N-glycosylation enzyme membrane subunit Stt3
VVLFASVGAATAPAGPMGPDPQVVGPVVFGVVALLVGIGAIYALLGLVLTLMLPVALYVDANELTESTVDWSPDPILYGLVGLLNFLAAPFVGIIVAIYYLYRRHEHVGTP